jgi:hypothetical protein
MNPCIGQYLNNDFYQIVRRIRSESFGNMALKREAGFRVSEFVDFLPRPETL